MKKITQAIHLSLDICKNGKLFFNPGISKFQISIHLRTNSESNPNSNLRYILLLRLSVVSSNQSAMIYTMNAQTNVQDSNEPSKVPSFEQYN